MVATVYMTKSKLICIIVFCFEVEAVVEEIRFEKFVMTLKS